MNGKKLSPAQFNLVAPKLRSRLIAGIEKERQDCALPEVGGKPGSDLWSDLPPVDSKTVAKMSPIVKDLTGRRLDPRWIKKGGYSTVEAAADHILAQFKEHSVAAEPAMSPFGSVPLLATN